MYWIQYDRDMVASDAVRRVLNESGLTKSDLSRRSGVSRALIDGYLKGHSQPSVAQLERLGHAAGLRLDLSWEPIEKPGSTQWAAPPPTMEAPHLTIAQRARVLERVVAVAAHQQRHERGELRFPPFRTLVRR